MFQIGGSNTTMNGPAYLAFDSSKRLYVTNYGAASKTGSLLVFQTYATGDVLPFGTVPFSGNAQAHGIAMMPKDAGVVVAFTQPGGFFTSSLNIYGPFTNGTLNFSNAIAGTNTQLNNPIGVAVDSSSNIYAANSGSGTITIYPAPTPSPTPSGSPSPTPSPTPTSSTSPSASPSPTPTPSSLNIAPTTTITCSCLHQPTGLALDAGGNLYVTDPGSKPPAIYEFASGFTAGTIALAPLRVLTSPTLLNPTDVKVDSAGTVYVVDQGNGPNTSSLLIFPAGATSPSTTIALPSGNATGLALSP
jgi:sugar lactone lactonase YvrE